MEIINIKIGEREFKMFEIEVCGNCEIVAEERLNLFIEEMIEKNKYDERISNIDDMFGYVVPQEIADTLDETAITQSIADIYENQ